MAKAYLFPGQGTQFPGMARDLYENQPAAKKMMEDANDILGFRITDTMFDGTAEELKATDITQPAVFLHSVAMAACIGEGRADMMAGHSLGEFSALVASGALSFEDGLRLVTVRAKAMQKACELQPSTMAAIIALPDETVERICSETEGIVVAANFNTPGQVVISGTVEAVGKACEAARAAGAKRALPVAVGGAFHSPLMEPARLELAQGIEKTPFHTPYCPIYQNVCAIAVKDAAQIKANLLKQLTSPVRWTETVRNMIADGADRFIEIGPGSVLRGMLKRIAPEKMSSGEISGEDGSAIIRQTAPEQG